MRGRPEEEGMAIAGEGEKRRKKAKGKAAMTPSIFRAVVQMIIIIDHAASNARIPLRSKTNDAAGGRQAREHAQGPFAIHK